jgi:hypothetical protein
MSNRKAIAMFQDQLPPQMVDLLRRTRENIDFTLRALPARQAEVDGLQRRIEELDFDPNADEAKKRIADDQLVRARQIVRDGQVLLGKPPQGPGDPFDGELDVNARQRRVVELLASLLRVASRHEREAP